MILQKYWTLFLGYATFDKDSKKAYVNVANLALPGSVAFSIGDNVLAIMDGSNFFLAKVEAFETMGDAATMELSFYGVSIDYLFNSGSEKPVLLKELSKSKELVKPFAIIDVAAVPTAAVLSALKERIALLGPLTFAEAFALVGLDTSSQVTAKFDAGNPNITAETFCADKVKAKHLKKGDNDFLEICDGSQLGILASDDQQKQERLYRYLDQMRAALREEDGGAFFNYSVSLVDKNLNVVLNNQSVKRVRRTRNGGEINYTLEFESGALMAFSALPYTIIIENKTVKKSDIWGWYGSSGIPTPSSLGLWNKEIPLEVKYLKKYNDDLVFLELDRSPDWAFGFIWGSPNLIASLTVDNRSIFGALKLTEDNRVQITKPANVSELAWAKGMAAFKTSGTGILSPLKVGSLAKEEMLQLKVDLSNLDATLNVYKTFQAIPSLTVTQLLSSIGTLKVINADVAAAKAGVNTLTGIAALATGTVKWFNDYVEFHVKNNSNETFNVVNSDGADEVFREVNLDTLLNAVVLENKANYEKELQNIINPTSAVGGDFTVWTANVQVMGESYQVKIWNAEVKQTRSGTIYTLFYDQGIPEVLPFLLAKRDDDVIVKFTRTESQRAL